MKTNPELEIRELQCWRAATAALWSVAMFLGSASVVLWLGILLA